MGTIHVAAEQGSLLTTTDLDKYRTSAVASFNIDEFDPNGRSALAYAAWKGHVDVVKLLVNEGSDIQLINHKNRTALWYATDRSISAQNRHEILNFLLERGADPNVPAHDNSTALMKIVQHREVDNINLLIEYNALADMKKGADGPTARDLALKTQDPKVIRALEKKKDRALSLGGIIDVILKFILWCIGFLNESFNRFLKNLYGIQGTSVTQIRREMQAYSEPTTTQSSGSTAPNDVPAAEFQDAEGFRTGMKQFLDETGLNNFYGEDDPFLQHVADRAARLREDPTNRLKSLDDVQKLVKVNLYKPIVYCDDSSSMWEGTRVQDQIEIVKRIVRISTTLVPDGHGSGLQFINYPRDLGTRLTAKEVEDILITVKPAGGTQLGTNLRKKILDPLVYDIINRGDKLERPIFVSVITDGCPNNEQPETFKQEVLECLSFVQKNGYANTALRFLISQIGDDKDAEDFLRKIQKDPRLEGLVYCTTQRLDKEFKILHQNEEDLERWLLKVLVAPLMDITEY